jgi:hypothetical protein
MIDVFLDNFYNMVFIEWYCFSLIYEMRKETSTSSSPSRTLLKFNDYWSLPSISDASSSSASTSSASQRVSLFLPDLVVSDGGGFFFCFLFD